MRSGLFLVILLLLAGGCGNNQTTTSTETSSPTVAATAGTTIGATVPASTTPATTTPATTTTGKPPGTTTASNTPPPPVLDAAAGPTIGRLTTMPPRDGANSSLDLSPPGEGVPEGPRLDFLASLCDENECIRDAHMVLSDDDESGYGVWIAESPFNIRHGFVDHGSGLWDGYDVSVLVRRESGPGSAPFPIGTTFVFTPDRVVTATTAKCGPGYWEQTEPVACRWFVHDFPDGLPPGRYDIWVVWQAPCVAWLELGATGTCDDASEPTVGFWSLVNMPFYSGDYLEDLPRLPRGVRDLEPDPITRGL